MFLLMDFGAAWVESVAVVEPAKQSASAHHGGHGEKSAGLGRLGALVRQVMEPLEAVGMGAQLTGERPTLSAQYTKGAEAEDRDREASRSRERRGVRAVPSVESPGRWR